MPKLVDMDLLSSRIRKETAGQPLSQSELARRLGVSQSSVSRCLRQLPSAVRIGGGRGSKYATRRTVDGVPDEVAVYRVDANGHATSAGRLVPLFDRGFVWHTEDGARVFEGWPYLLNSIRPSGFLGRRIAERHPELALPDNVADWNDDYVLRYVTRFGWNLPGDWIIGDAAYRSCARARANTASTQQRFRVDLFARRVDDVLGDEPGSSAGGEQPKFLAWVEGAQVLVKFSPALTPRNLVARRLADLLVCEHLALETLRSQGRSAASSEIVTTDTRYYLQVERFDRVGLHGRRGVIALQALYDELCETRERDWVSVARELSRLGHVPESCVEDARWLQVFGRLIGNTDMHLGNLSAWLDGTRVGGLAPAYDMVPMFWAPSRSEIVERAFHIDAPVADDWGVFPDVANAAKAFWTAVSTDERVSRGFRAIARQAAGLLASMTPTL